MVKVGEVGVHRVSRCPGQFRIEDRGRWHGPDAWLARAGRRVLLRREIARVLRWFGMPSEHNCGAWRGQAAEPRRAVRPPSVRVHSAQETRIAL